MRQPRTEDFTEPLVGLQDGIRSLVQQSPEITAKKTLLGSWHQIWLWAGLGIVGDPAEASLAFHSCKHVYGTGVRRTAHDKAEGRPEYHASSEAC